MRKKKKTVLITGCSSGIGYATAKRLVRNGHHVYATARKLENVAELKQAGCETLALDVTNEASMNTAVETVLKSGSLDVLVNNAGYGLHGPIEEVPIDEIRQQFETNVFGLIRMTQLVLPGMREQKSGLIVNIGSMGGRISFPGGGPYHATKYAVEAISDSLRYEVKGFGIKVSLIEPGVIQSEWGSRAIDTFKFDPKGPYAKWSEKHRELFEKTYDGHPSLGQGGSDDVAQVVEKAINSRHPRSRYLVTQMAYGLVYLRHFLPGKAWDLVLRTSYPKPPR